MLVVTKLTPMGTLRMNGTQKLVSLLGAARLTKTDEVIYGTAT